MTGGAGSVFLVLAADPAADVSSSGPIVIIVITVVTVLGTIATALGPTFVEIVKSRGGRRSTQPPANDPPSSGPVTPAAAPDNPLSRVLAPGIDALAMVDAAVQDYRKQRDAALQRVDELQQRLDEANHTISRQLVYIARLEANQSPPEPYGRRPMYPDPNEWQR